MQHLKIEKGTFIKWGKKPYIVVGHIENDFNINFPLLVSLTDKHNRFSYKKMFSTNLDKKYFRENKNSSYIQIIKEENISINEKDKTILKDFIHYVQNNEFIIEGNVFSYTSYDKNTYYSSRNVRIVNMNLKPYKKYMKENHI